MSGAERFVKEVAERLKGNRFFVVITAKLRPDLPDEEDLGGYRVVRVGRGNKWDKIRYIWLAPQEAKKYNPWIIHAVMESYAGLALWRAKKILPGVKRILTLQSGDLDKKIWSKIPFLWSGIHRSPDYITAISNFLAARAKRLGAKNVQVVPNGFDFSRMYAKSMISRHRIISVARLSWEKDHKNLIAAMPKVLEKYSDAEMVLVGDGPLKRTIERQIKKMDLRDKVKLSGNQFHDDVLRELAKSDVFICPSLAEGLGIVFIEAQACGVPAIGTNVGGIPDIIENGRTGILIEPNNSDKIANAILRVFDMPQIEREHMILEAERNVREKFNWDNIAKKVDDLYEKLLRGLGKNILICTGIYPPDIGGPATYTKLISEELKKHEHEVRVLSYSSSVIPAPLLNGINSGGIRSVSRKYPPILRHFLYFLEVLKLGKNADIIYIQDPVSAGLPSALANIFLKKKLILKIVGDYAWEQGRQITNLDDFYPFNKNHPFKIKLFQKIQTWVAKRAEKIITPSFYLKNILTSGWKINPEKIKVIYNSFDISRQPTPVVERAAFTTGQAADSRQPERAAFKILSVGRLVPWKGFDTLIEIMKNMPNAELEIIGDGPEFETLRIKRQMLNVRLLGRLSHDEVVQKMRSSDLFILNSAYEGLSHVILEAMACELPVAVSRAGGNTELVGENEERGHLFDYNNKEQIKEKINYIFNHQDEVKEKAKKAREFVADFSKDKMLEKLEEALQFLPLR